MATEHDREQHFSVAVSQKAIDSGLLLENLLTRLGATEDGKAVLTGKMRVKLPNRVKPMWESMGTGEQLNFIIESFITPPAAAVTEQAPAPATTYDWNRGQ